MSGSPVVPISPLMERARRECEWNKGWPMGILRNEKFSRPGLGISIEN